MIMFSLILVQDFMNYNLKSKIFKTPFIATRSMAFTSKFLGEEEIKSFREYSSLKLLS